VSSWEKALDRGERRQLLRLHPERSLQEIAVAVLDHPMYAQAFRRTGARVVSYEEALAQYERRGAGVLVVPPRADWFPRVEVPPRGREEFVALLLLAAEDTETLDGVPVSEARPSLPGEKQLNTYSYASLEKAVKDFGRDRTRGDVVRGAKLPPQDARRVRLMFDVGLFRLNALGRLVVGERVARKGSRYVLRYLDESGTRWLDPNVELRGR
jgi:hypothetical protein